ncbi:hypothetical protein [Psychromonas sp. SP041]|uniref:hypothetical protein n=1 Tax=Psychromonas sp. SP041 TaxID=1365007 RepID=UPI00041796BA|nr:hypothetical protein [Psychromonas sp. SP041]
MNNQSSRCFPLPKISQAALDKFILSDNANGKRIEKWIALHAKNVKTWEITDQYALAHLIPLILCGEQSAQLVFNQEINRLFSENQDDNQTMIKSLLEVEADEHRHDQALQAILNALPIIENKRHIQRQAQRFYAQLGRGEDRCQHFIKIATLDACVTQVMHEFEHCLLGVNHPFSHLCGLIKKDEAKHVYVARHHAQALGATSAMFRKEQHSVSHLLHQLLDTQVEHFHFLGVDLNKIFTNLERKWQ